MRERAVPVGCRLAMIRLLREIIRCRFRGLEGCLGGAWVLDVRGVSSIGVVEVIK